MRRLNTIGLTLMLMVLVAPLTGFGPASPANTIFWSPSHRLSWDDFKGAPDNVSSMRALTSSRINYTFACYGSRFKTEVTAEFLPEKSWVKSNPSVNLLRHEQAHFDITELCARRMRKKFASLSDACTRGKSYIDAEAQVVFDEWHDLQNEYDEETDHGKNADAQSEWGKWIRNQLTALEQYSAGNF